MGFPLIIMWSIVAAGIYQATKDFRMRVMERYDYDIYGWPIKFAYAIATICTVSAYCLYTSSPLPQLPAHANRPFWIVLAIFAFLLIVGVTAFNFVKADRETAMIASGAQIFVAPSILMYAVAVFVLTFIVAYFFNRTKGPDPIEEQQKAYEAWMASDLNKDSPNYRFKNDKNGGY